MQQTGKIAHLRVGRAVGYCQPPGNPRNQHTLGGELREPLKGRGYTYINLDLVPHGDWSVVGDAHRVPFQDEAFHLVVSKDSLEHFVNPRTALQEIRRIIESDGTLVIWVPFLHPFHGTDFYRYTPLGLQALLRETGFMIISIESPPL